MIKIVIYEAIVIKGNKYNLEILLNYKNVYYKYH